MTGPTKRIAVIQYLRGIASLSVAWFHVTGTWNGPARMVGHLGYLGVEVFFVISGFVIPYSIAATYEHYAPADIGNFFARRIIRIELPFLFSILLVILLQYLSSWAPGFRGGPPAFTAWQIASNVLYIAPITGAAWIQPVYWTLAYEFVFYITVGLLFGLLFGPQSKQVYFLALGALVLAVIAGLADGLLLLFAMGTAVFRAASNRNSGPAVVGAVAICTLAIAYATTPTIAVVGLMTALGIHFGRNIQIAGLAGKALSFLGAISYSLYLVHVPVGGRVVNLAHRIAWTPAEQLLASLAAIALSLVAAILFYRVIERPAMATSHRLFALTVPAPEAAG